MAQRIQVPILILTGFLGSGKTSLLSRWLRAPEFSGAMVVVNELGEVGLDDRLVQHSSDVPLLLENGCACCEAAEDLNATLERLFMQRLHRVIPKFNWLLIETTGIADPVPLVASLNGSDLIRERYRIAGIVTTVDARRGPAHISAHAECRSQLAAADLAILTKTDIAGPGEQAAARGAIASVNPALPVTASSRSDLAAGSLLAALDRAAHATGSREGASGAAGHSHGIHEHDGEGGYAHDHSGDHGHSHTHAHHLGDVTTAFVALSAPLAWGRLAPVLEEVLATWPQDLLRLKGTARTGPGGAIEVIQAIAGEDMQREPFAGNAGAPDRGKPVPAGLTLIARHTPANAIAATILARLGLPAGEQAQVDGLTPEAAANG